MESADSVLRMTDPLGHLLAHLQHGVRYDGRSPLEARAVTVTDAGPGSGAVFGTSTAHLGAGVTAVSGGTRCLCNIGVLLGKPSLEHPQRGDMAFDVVLGAAAGLRYESDKAGKKHDDALDLEGFLRDVWCPAGGGSSSNSSAPIDLASLCVERGKLALRLHVSVLFLSANGNLQDCAMAAVAAALRQTWLPRVVRSVGSDSAVAREGGRPLVPVGSDAGLLQAATFAVCALPPTAQAPVNRAFLRDPTLQEEGLVRSTVTVVTALGSSGSSTLRGVFTNVVENCGSTLTGSTAAAGRGGGVTQPQLQELIRVAATAAA